MKKASKDNLQYALGGMLCAALMLGVYMAGGMTASAQTKIVSLAPLPKPYCIMTADVVQTEVGPILNLVWVTSRASSVKISGIGSVGATGSMLVLPRQSTSYTLTASAYGSTPCNSVMQVVVN